MLKFESLSAPNAVVRKFILPAQEASTVKLAVGSSTQKKQRLSSNMKSSRWKLATGLPQFFDRCLGLFVREVLGYAPQYIQLPG